MKKIIFIACVMVAIVFATGYAADDDKKGAMMPDSIKLKDTVSVAPQL